MVDNEVNESSMSTSRRTLLKGAVGAGVGLAAWSAPKIGTIPAYALTNSTGVFDNVCYYFVWNINLGRWGRGAPNPNGGGSSGNDTGYGDTVVPPGGTTNRTITWNDVFGPGQDLTASTSGDPTAVTGTVTLGGIPTGCVLEGVGSTTYDGRPSNPPGSGTVASCATTVADGSVTFLPLSSSIQVTVPPASAVNTHYVIFNINCD